MLFIRHVVEQTLRCRGRLFSEPQVLATVIRDENMELGRHFSACVDTIVLRVVGKLDSLEDTLNQKFASFETQPNHPVPSPTGGIDKKFKVILFIHGITPIILT